MFPFIAHLLQIIKHRKKKRATFKKGIKKAGNPKKSCTFVTHKKLA